MEFAALSRLTGDLEYERKAHHAMDVSGKARGREFTMYSLIGGCGVEIIIINLSVLTMTLLFCYLWLSCQS